jgi:hypothetical protein
MKTMICLENVSYSQFNYESIEYINTLTRVSNEEVCFVSLDQTMPFMDINTAVFSPMEMDSFNNGVIISHTIKGAELVLGCSNNSKKVLYLYDLDWMFQPMFYHDIHNVLSNENLRIIVRSEDYLKPLSNIYKTKKSLAVMNNFNLEEIWNSL